MCLIYNSINMKGVSTTIITSYIDPDLDGVACLYAYAEYLNKRGVCTKAMISGTPYIEATWLLKKLKINLPQLIIQSGDTVVLTDTSDPDDIDPKIPLDTVIKIIDHRSHHNAHLFPKATIQIEEVGAAATLVAEKFYRENILPSKNAAMLLYGGIVSNTLNFKSKLTTERDITMSTWLKKLASISDSFSQEMFQAKSDFSGRIMKDVLNADITTPKKFGLQTILISQIEMIGSKRLFQTRGKEIRQALKEILSENKATIVFLSCIDLEEGTNYFYCIDAEGKKFVENILQAQSEEDYFISTPMILRKEILPLLVKHYST